MTPTVLQPSSDPRALRLASKPRRRRTVISLTPLIDVVFILLIFFMLATALEQWNAIQLDAPSRAAVGPAMEGAVLIDVRPDGLRLSGTPIAPDALSARVGERLRTKPEQRFLVRASKGVPLQGAIAVLDRVAAAGGRNVSLIRETTR